MLDSKEIAVNRQQEDQLRFFIC